MNDLRKILFMHFLVIAIIGVAAADQVAFDRPVDYITGCEALRKLVIADFNSDSHLDVAVACQIEGAVIVLLGNGDGSFADEATNFSVEAIEPLGVAAGDWDGDGDIDLATANSGANENIGSVSILLNDGTGQFEIGEVLLAGERPRFILACNLNGDSYPDLAVTNSSSNDLSVLINNGDGTFTPLVETYPLGAGPRDVTAGDFDMDGNIDLAIANDGVGNKVSEISVLFNNGNGTFAVAITYAVGDGGFGSGPWSIVATDLNQDGDIDLAVVPHGNSNVWVLANNGEGIFAEAIAYASGGGAPSSLVLGDIDGDDALDVAVVHYNHTWSYLLNEGNGTFGEAVNSDVTGSNPESIAFADLDEDGDLDVVISVLSGAISVILNNPLPPPCLGDLNDSGSVNVSDLLILFGFWGVCSPECLGDLDDNGIVDTSDLLILFANWGPCP